MWIQNRGFILRFRIFSVPDINDSLFNKKHKTCTAVSCVCLPAWPRVWNYISWNTAVCTYPRFISDIAAETCWFSKELVSRHYKSKAIVYSVCFGSFLPKVRSKWIVHLQTTNLQRDGDGDSDDAGPWGNLTNTTFESVLNSYLFLSGDT
jgi:hypothetical protein